jgi:uncharacterized protein YndB with AHSA1/START domain/uncharacterized protein YciI
VNAVPPIRREILVDTDPATAFEVFTERLGRWWPLAELSVYGAHATVAFTDGQIIERSADGEAAVWGTVTRWEPPDAVGFSWHPGQPAESASHVEVTFAAAEGQTRVRLEHSGWEALADPLAARAEYDHGWPMVLDRYRDYAADHGEQGDTWVALLHRPGPAAPATGTLLEDPRFGEHIAFLNRMREAGYLVAAGPLPDAAGEGMTILRLPGPGQLSLAMRLATEDDTSVSAGFLAVTVRLWHVVMHA